MTLWQLAQRCLWSCRQYGAGGGDTSRQLQATERPKRWISAASSFRIVVPKVRLPGDREVGG